MLDRRQLPAPLGRESEGDTTVIWQDADGKVWRYVPLRGQLRDMLTTVRRQLAPASRLLSGAAISSMLSGLALAAVSLWTMFLHPQRALGTPAVLLTAVPLVPLAVLLWGLGVAGLGLLITLQSRHLPQRLLAQWRQTFDRPALLAWLFDDTLCRLLLERRQRSAPLYVGLWGEPRTIESWVMLVAFQAGKLIERDLHVEALRPLEIVPGMKQSRVNPLLPLYFTPVIAWLVILLLVPVVAVSLQGATSFAVLMLPQAALFQLTMFNAFYLGQSALRPYSALQALLEVLLEES